MQNNYDNPVYTIGVDLGGTTTSFAIVDSLGNIIEKGLIPTRTDYVEQWADNLCAGIKNIIECSGIGDNIKGIGIGAPCANASTGYIEAATDLPWKSPIPLASMIESRLGYRTVITNDANAAAIGEMTYGSAIGLKNFIVLTLGTGVGSGIVCDGHLLSGTRGFAGELGHMTFSFASDRECACGRKGCLQTVASAKGILETTRRFLKECDQPSSLRDIPSHELSPLAVQQAAVAGDKIAQDIYDFTGRCLGKAAAEFASITDPEAIILFGGVSKAGDLLLKPMKEAFSQSVLHLYRDTVKLSLSGLCDADAAILGAASLPYLD